MRNQVLTVSQLNRYVKMVLEEQPPLRELYIKGELSGFSRHYQSGHLYFQLKDDQAAVKGVMFREYARQLAFEPRSGMTVIARCSAALYERDGQFQVYVYDLQPDGLGAAYLAWQQTKERLEREGLTDPARKRPLPPAPKRIGVVTSQGGAALQDILNILSRRWPLATVVLSPAPVQGADAPPKLIRALQRLDGRCDVIILGRGGGSAEDLAAFNDETLARAVAACGTPVVSAVGHETDFSICDLVADLRAPTPSAAAELVSPYILELKERVDGTSALLAERAFLYIQRKNRDLCRITDKIHENSPEKFIERNGQRLGYLVRLLTNAYKDSLRRQELSLGRLTASLSRLNPAAVLARGYTITTLEDHPVTSAQDLFPGQRIVTRFADGEVVSVVEETHKEDVYEEDPHI